MPMGAVTLLSEPKRVALRLAPRSNSCRDAAFPLPPFKFQKVVGFGEKGQFQGKFMMLAK